VQVLILSVDPVERSRAFAASLQAPYPILMDPQGKTAARYGVLDANGLAKRKTSLVGKDGKVHRFEKVVVDTHGPHLIKVLETLLPVSSGKQVGGEHRLFCL